LKLRGTIQIEYTLACRGANKLWHLLQREPYIAALGALTGNQAVQMVRAGLKAIYLSGWQVAADANTSGDMYPDQSLYPANSGPELCRRINKSLRRADQIEAVEAKDYCSPHDWYAPIVADAEAGFGGSLNCFEIMKAYIEAGAAGVHFEDQLGSEKKCGHMGGKILIPTGEHIRHLNAARLAADVCGVSTIIIARTDAESSRLITSDNDERDHGFIDRKAGRTSEGFYRLKNDAPVQYCIERAKHYAPYSDLIWMETSYPKLSDAKEFVEGVRKEYPDKLFAYNCSPSFNWRKHLRQNDLEKFQKELGAMGFKFQFVTLAGFHCNSYSTYDLARKYRKHGMIAYSELQELEFKAEKYGYSAVKHQHEVGTGYFDYVANTVAGGKASTVALSGSTEEAQFYEKRNNSSSSTNIFQVAPVMHDHEKIITPDAIRYIRELHEKFNGRRLQLLAEREILQAAIDRGDYYPDFDKATKALRNDTKWKGSKIPDDMMDRRVEITGPTDRKMIVDALNSGAKVFVADFEDSNVPSWRNQLDGQVNLYDAVRENISFTDLISKKQHFLKKKHAVINVRPRGWHLPEKHVLINGEPISGSLFDFGLYLYHNAKILLQKGSGPYFYLPKLQNAAEAKLWADVFEFSEKRLGLQNGFIKCTAHIEHLLATFQMDEIIYNLSKNIIGLNCGRWDYIFSFIKVFRNHSNFLLPDRFQIGMTSPFLRNYALLCIKSSHLRNIAALGGMAAQIPIKNNAFAKEQALKVIRQDKEREANDGHDGTWVAHPDLVPVAQEVFDSVMLGKNQICKQLPSFNVTNVELTAVPDGKRTEKGLRYNISITLDYLESWLRGTGCVPLYNIMEDAATAEISRAQIWQWLHHEAKFEDGRRIDFALVKQVIEEETERKLTHANPAINRFLEAAELLGEFCTEPILSDFLTLKAYDRIIS
uniref:Malate synthase n=1 Tax=Dracunculus medinensis TaxID=318479 RepID=A0A0N4U1E1_DRAME